MTTTVAMTLLDEAAFAAESALARAAPHLVDAFREALPRAADVVTRRLVGAAYREEWLGSRDPGGRAVSWAGDQVWLPGPAGARVSARATRHAFDRIEVHSMAGPCDPARVLESLTGGTYPDVAEELTDAVVNLAVAYARQEPLAAGRDTIELAQTMNADEQCLFFERLATEGHNLHPCGRTRLGWTVPDLLAHDLEAGETYVGLVGVHRELHVGDDVGALLAPEYPELTSSLDPSRYALTPVHAWQLERVVRERYADLVATGALVPVEGVRLPAAPTAALRTLLLPRGQYLKVSLDIQVTSTRRTISIASTRNGPAISALLSRALAEEEWILLMAEYAGAAMRAPGGRERDLAAIVRSGLAGRLEPDEVAVPGSALPAVSPLTGRTVLAELVDRYAQTRGTSDPAPAFLAEYARMLLPPVLRLATRYGIGLEAHLQNSIPTFVGGVPYRLALRDFAGLRVFPGRLPAELPLWPGSVVVAEEVDAMRAKIAYTALQAHLGELIVRLVDSHGLDEWAAWAGVRAIVDEVYSGLDSPAARADHAFLTAPTLPHKALLTMRLAGTGDIYVPVANPLA